MKRKSILYFVDGGTYAIDILIDDCGHYKYKGFTKFFDSINIARDFAKKYTEETEEYTTNYVLRRNWIK